MPISNYSVLKGRANAKAIDQGQQAPHYHVLIESAEGTAHVAVNMRSTLERAPLLYLLDDDFRHPLTQRLIGLPDGFTRLPHLPNSGAIDYIRGSICDRRRFRPAPRPNHGVEGLAALLDAHVERAISDPEAVVYAFGSRWGPKHHEIDRTFPGQPIKPSDGIHDIHMNQGNVNKPGHRDDHFFYENGPWQDGALLVHFAGQEQWVGLFTAFQSQIWHTDDRTGRPLFDATHAGPAQRPHEEEPDFTVKIVAAMVNPEGPAPEHETVTLLNATRQEIDLKGWAILNREHARTRLRGKLPPGGSRSFRISPLAPLTNNGGTITLIDAAGLKVDGVAYSASDARREGWLMTF